MDPEERVIQFWCGELREGGLAPADKSARWFQKNSVFDREIREAFCGLHAELLSGSRPAWSLAPRGLAAAVIVLDQFSRNMFRDTPGMFAADPRALSLCLEALGLGFDRALPSALRSLVYMPLMHAEDVRMQRRCVELFAAFRDESEGEVADFAGKTVGYAESHREIIERFGRFPHRNQVLGRETTAEEHAFLEQPGSSF